MNTAADVFADSAREAERAAVVAYLLELAQSADDANVRAYFRVVAVDIREGEHLK